MAEERATSPQALAAVKLLTAGKRVSCRRVKESVPTEEAVTSPLENASATSRGKEKCATREHALTTAMMVVGAIATRASACAKRDSLDPPV